MFKKLLLLLPALLLITACNEKQTKDTVHPVDLRCEMLKDPLGIDVKEPRLSWKLTSDQKGELQTAYQVMFSSSKELLNNDEGDVWDSEKVETGQSIHVKYEGAQLQSGQQVFWKVRCWDKEGEASKWSKTATFSIGLLSQEDWKAKWIGLNKAVGKDDPKNEFTKLSARYLRKKHSLEKEVKKATAYLCGLGLSELYINGQKVGDHVLSPGQTQFDKRVFYVTHDVTDLLQKGENAIGVILGNGRFFPMRQKEPFLMEGYGFPMMILQIDVEYTDGSTAQIISDESWKITADGPITENNEFDGEKYDARKAHTDFDRTGYDDSGWRDVELVSPPANNLTAQMNEPIRITEEIKPISVNKVEEGKYIFDMGQNMVGWAELTVKGDAGTAVKMRFAEALQDDGNLYLDNIRSAKVTDIYTCKGNGEEVWEPRFTYHGFRFVEMTGYPGEPDVNTITGKVVHDDVERIGQFECNLDMVNNIARNAIWGIRGNYRSFPTDCPQRDERQAWLGDRATGSRGESYIFDISKLYAKWMRDIGDAQLEHGSISDVCPAYWGIYNDNITWEGTPIILADMLYDQYGDFEVIRRSYPYLKKWYVYMNDTYLEDGLMPRDSYGDWCMPPAEPELIHSKDPSRITSGTYLGTTFFYHMSGLMKQFAQMLNKEADADYFANQEDIIKKAFNENYFDENFVTYANNTGTASILALAFGLVEEQYKEQIFNNLIEKIETQFKGHIPVGLVGAQFLMRTLTKYGRPDVAIRFATQNDYPSWGYMVENGATTIWELWNGNTADPAMNSRNHVMLLGDYNIWLYENLGGIKPAEPAFKQIIMKPAMVEGLEFVNASHVSLYGEIKSEWKRKNGTLSWNIAIPVNTSARVYVPAGSEKDVKIPASDAINFVEFIDGYAVYQAGSGNYEITSKNFAVYSDGGDMAAVVEIGVSNEIDTKPVEVTLNCATESADIYYTLDGADPDEGAKKYNGSFMVEKSCLVKARAFKDGLEPGFSTSQKVVIYDPDKNGLNYSYYEGKWTKIPDFSALTPEKTGKINNISDLAAMKDREDYWGILFEGFIEIEKDGEYYFSTSSDDGSRLFIDGKQLVDNDGIHGVMEKQGKINLKAGIYPLCIEFFEGNYGEVLELNYSGPGIPRHMVPVSMLFFEE